MYLASLKSHGEARSMTSSFVLTSTYHDFMLFVSHTNSALHVNYVKRYNVVRTIISGCII